MVSWYPPISNFCINHYMAVFFLIPLKPATANPLSTRLKKCSCFQLKVQHRIPFLWYLSGVLYLPFLLRNTNYFENISPAPSSAILRTHICRLSNSRKKSALILQRSCFVKHLFLVLRHNVSKLEGKHGTGKPGVPAKA